MLARELFGSVVGRVRRFGLYLLEHGAQNPTTLRQNLAGSELPHLSACAPSPPSWLRKVEKIDVSPPVYNKCPQQRNASHALLAMHKGVAYSPRSRDIYFKAQKPTCILHNPVRDFLLRMAWSVASISSRFFFPRRCVPRRFFANLRPSAARPRNRVAATTLAAQHVASDEEMVTCLCSASLNLLSWIRRRFFNWLCRFRR